MGIRWGGRLLAIALLCAWGAGCQPVETRGEVFERYRARLEALKSAAAEAFRLDDPADMITGLVAGVPKPFLKSPNGRADLGNVAMFPASWLLSGEDPEVDLNIESPLREALSWLQYPDRMGANAPSDETFIERLEAALATPYVGVYSIEAYQEPRAISNAQFMPGSMKVLVGLTDLKHKSLIVSCRALASSSKELQYTLQKGETHEDAAEFEGYYDLLQNVREQVGVCLAEQSGGEFDLKY